MKQLNQEEAKRICDRVMGFSKADECSVDISGNRAGNVRFARNSISTAGLNEDMTLTVQVAFGKKSGIAQLNEFDDKSLEKAVRRAEELARLAPENPEFMPAVEMLLRAKRTLPSRLPPMSTLHSSAFDNLMTRSQMRCASSLFSCFIVCP